MGFDQRVRFAGDPGQQAWGGINRFNNCAPAAHLNAWKALRGNYPCSPQDITDVEYGPSYVGGELFALVIDFIQSRPDLFPNPPEITINEMPAGDVLDVLEEYGSQGFPMVFSFWCDVNGRILTTSSPYQHASNPDYLDDENVITWNAEGYEQVLSRADFVSAFTGAVVVFHESCLPPQPKPAPRHREEDDMYLKLKAGVGEVWPVAPDTDFNLLALTDGSVEVISYQPDGTPITEKTYQLSGNQPNVHGPVQIRAAASDLGIGEPGGSLDFTASVDAALWLHREP